MSGIYQERIFFPSKAKTLLRLVQFIVNWPRTLLCQLAYALSKNKKLVQSDFGTYGNMVRSLIFGKHNRNLFYHRMGRTSLFYSWLLSGDKSIKLPFSCQLGRHIHFVHNDSCHLNAQSIGDNFICYPHVVLGTKSLRDNSKPTIGNDVTIGTGAVVVGGIHIGNNVTIAANAFVCQDVPDNSRVFGNPAIIKSTKER